MRREWYIFWGILVLIILIGSILTITANNSYKAVFWVETTGEIIGLFLALWFPLRKYIPNFIKKHIWEDRDLYECDYCHKQIYGKEECRKHEERCKNKKI